MANDSLYPDKLFMAPSVPLRSDVNKESNGLQYGSPTSIYDEKTVSDCNRFSFKYIIW